jgi:NAD(P)-dependent dehydrogenase (short-subunit alcohol dehydrogenase family)
MGTDRDRLDGRRALVTGGSKGTGKAVVERLREMGADVYTTARTMPDGDDRPDRFIEADTATAAGTDPVAARVAEGGPLDVLVHVVGGASTPSCRSTTRRWRTRRRRPPAACPWGGSRTPRRSRT